MTSSLVWKPMGYFGKQLCHFKLHPTISLYSFQLNYTADGFFENVLNNLKARTIREMSQLDEKVNRTLWTATPAVVNAYYSRNRNQISNEITLTMSLTFI